MDLPSCPNSHPSTIITLSSNILLQTPQPSASAFNLGLPDRIHLLIFLLTTTPIYAYGVSDNSISLSYCILDPKLKISLGSWPSPCATMEIERSASLGSFTKLPSEIRVLIWEELLSFRISKLYPKERRRESRRLSILRSSRYLYQEIVGLVYKRFRHYVTILPHNLQQGWMVVQCQSKWSSVTWSLESKADAQRYFLNFPLDKCCLRVHIHAPHPRDEGQNLLLWQKVNALVDVLSNVSLPLPHRPMISLYLRGKFWWKRNKCIPPHKSRSRQSLLYHTSQPDHDIVTVPFYRLLLRGWRSQHGLPRDLHILCRDQSGYSDNVIFFSRGHNPRLSCTLTD